MTENDPRLVFVPLEELQTPKDGYECMTNRWWSVHPEKGAILYRSNKRHPGSPQCNSDLRITELLTKKLYPWAVAHFVPAAFIEIKY